MDFPLNFSYLFEDSALLELIETRNLRSWTFYSILEDVLLLDDSLEVSTLSDFYAYVKQIREKVDEELGLVVQLFEWIDNDCNGTIQVADMERMLLLLGSKNTDTLMDRTMRSFPFSAQIPGPLDVFGDTKNHPLDRLVDFMFRNRCEFKKLLPRAHKIAVEKFEQRIEVLKSILPEFCTGEKLKNVEEVEGLGVEGKNDKSEESAVLPQAEENDSTSISYIWLLKVMGSVSSALVKISPTFAEEAVNHTKWALSLMDFFQLSQNLQSGKLQESQGPFSKGVIDEMRSFSHNLTKVTDAREVHLWFEFVCGDLAKILNIILSDQIPESSALSTKLKNSKNHILQKESILLEDMEVMSDGIKIHTPTPRYTSQPNSKNLQIVNLPGNCIAVTYLKIMVGHTSPKIQVFICEKNPLSHKEGGNPWHLVHTLIGSSHLGEQTISFDQPVFKKHILVNFESDGSQINNVGIGFYGVMLPSSLTKFAVKVEKEGLDNLALESLLFLSYISACQSHHTKRKPSKRFNFSTFSNACIDNETGILECNSSTMAMVSAQLPLSRGHPSFEIEVSGDMEAEFYMGLVGKGFGPSSQFPGLEPWSLAFHSTSGSFHEGSSNASRYSLIAKSNEKLTWKVDFEMDKMVLLFERDGKNIFRKECPDNMIFYPAIALKKGVTIKLLDDGPWRAQKITNSLSTWFDTEKVSIGIFLNLMKKFENDVVVQTCTLHLLYHMLPFISNCTNEDIKELHDLIISIIKLSEDEDFVNISRMVLARGIKMFYPSEEVRLNTFHELFESTLGASSKRESFLILEALCQHIAEHEPHVILKLPAEINDMDSEKILLLMEKLFALASVQLIGSDEDHKNSSFLHLISSLQTLIFAWCAKQNSSPDTENAVFSLISSYIRKFLDASVKEMDIVDAMNDDELVAFLNGASLLSTSFRQLLALIGQSCDWLRQSSRSKYSEILKTCYEPIKKFITKVCLDEKKWDIPSDYTLSLPWYYDVMFSFFHLIGRLCGLSIQVVSDQSALAKMVKGSEDDGLLTSDIWRLIFRAGLLTSSKQEVQRSLSGKHGAVIECEALSFLLCLNEEDNESARDFIKRCQKLSHKTNLAGGSHVTSAVVALFAALIWHTQPIRESLERYITSDPKTEIPKGVIHAYEAAEILRMPMMKKRQDLIEEKEQHKDEVDADGLEEEKEEGYNETFGEEEGLLTGSNGNHERIEGSENCPIADMKSKSEFLLQFAGLQKMQESETKHIKNLGSSVDKAQNQMKQSDLFAMYPSFQLVLDFVKDPLWNQKQVENLLESRRKQAVILSRSYKYIRDFLDAFHFEDVSNKIPKFCMPVFFGGLLEKQFSFPKHHLDFIDGCGLLMETKVRQEFYCLIKLMISTSSQLMTLTEGENSYTHCIHAATLHLLSINWQVEDFNTLLEADIVEFLQAIMLGYKLCDGKEELNLEEELKTYFKHKSWIKEAGNIGINDFKYPRGLRQGKEPEIDRMHFVSRYQLLYDFTYRCDVCSESLKMSEPGFQGYYRCLECVDFDVCLKCVNKQSSTVKHKTCHKLVLFKNVCTGCNGVILYTMHKCDKCPSMQWCSGCVHTQNYNHKEHNSTHILKMNILPPVSRQKAARSSISFYNQCHAAFQLSNVALQSLRYIGSSKDGSPRKPVKDFDYQRAVEQLYKQCIKGTVKILSEMFSEVEPESWKKDAQVGRPWGLQDILLGLLGKLLPTDETHTSTLKVWMDEEIFSSLCKMVSSDVKKDFDNCKSMALALLRKIFQLTDGCFSQEFISNHLDVLLEVGAGLFFRGKLEHCKLLVKVLQGPSSNLWREYLISKVEKKFINFSQEPNKLLLIFYALILTRFPELPSFGCLLAHHKSDDKRERKGILMKYGCNECHEVIDAETRKTIFPSKDSVTFLKEEVEIPFSLSLPMPNIIESIFQQLQENTKDYELMMWLLAILIKANKTFNLEESDKLAMYSILPRIVQKFLEGSKLSRFLETSKVEFILINLVTMRFEGSSSNDGDESLIGTDPLADIEDPDLKLQFEMLSDDENILNRYICRAIYDLYKNDRETLAGVLTTTVGTSILSDDIKEALKAVEAKYKNRNEKGEEVQQEEDLEACLNIPGLKIKQESELMRIEEVVMEEGTNKPVKISPMKSAKEINEMKQSKERSKKFDSIIKTSLEKAKSDEEYHKKLLKKASQTLMVMNCKHFILNFLSSSNFEEILKINFIPNPLPTLPSNEELWGSLVIYMLSKERGNESTKLLRNVVSSASPSTLQLLINLAHNFMLELLVTRNIDLKQDGGQGFIEVIGAESLFVEITKSQANQMDLPGGSSFVSEQRLIISSSASFEPVIHSLPISSNTNVEVQDDKFYYKIEGGFDDLNFAVIQKMRSKDLFRAGFEVIQCIVDDQNLFREVRVDNMWKRLLKLFYELNSSKRVKVLSLILKIVTSTSGTSLDLSLLSHAWNYYKRLNTTDFDLKPSAISQEDLLNPAIILGLTELFASLSGNKNISKVIPIIQA